MAPERIEPVSLRIAQALSESSTPHALLENVLRLLGEEFGWDFGAMWRIDFADVYMAVAGSWRRGGAHDFANFEEVSRARKMEFGQGIPGAIWKLRTDFWVEDLDTLTNFPRINIAHLDGLKSGAAVPICIEARVVGVLEFYARGKRAREEDTLQLMRAAATQMGAYLDRLRLEEGITGARAEFETLAEKSFDVIITIDQHSTIVFANPAMTRIFGYLPEEVRGKSLHILIPPRLRPRHDAGISQYVATGKKHVTWDGLILPAVHKSGLEFQVEIRFGEFQHTGRRLFTGYIRPLPRK
jgi:PAS domain S-box-containing protein